MTTSEMKKALIECIQRMDKAHCTDFGPMNEWHRLDQERKSGNFSAEITFATMAEVKEWAGVSNNTF